MANNRPINRRPWRRPPWRKTRRPASWHDANSTGTLGTYEGGPWAPLIAPVAGVAQATARALAVGQVDAIYLDREEVRIDRVVGDVKFWTASAYSGAIARPPVVRIGIIVAEDVGSAAPPVAGYSLWTADALGEYEWMYLEELEPTPTGGTDVGGDVGFRELYWSTHLDIRVKRKLGKMDNMYLVMTYGNGLESGLPATNDWASPVYHSMMLRTVLVS